MFVWGVGTSPTTDDKLFAFALSCVLMAPPNPPARSGDTLPRRPSSSSRGLLVALAAVVVAFLYRSLVACPSPLDAFAGKHVLITGTSSGIGVSLAEKFGRAGARLVLAARRAKELEATAALARAAGAQDVLVVPTDMGDSAAVEALVRTATEHFGGRIDLLLLNHALSEEHMVLEYGTAADLVRSVGQTMAVNLLGSAVAVQAALPSLERAGGHVAVVSSASAKTPAPFHGAYVASKRALHGYFDTLRHELHLSKSTVTVGILVLGLIGTPDIVKDEGLTALAISVPDCADGMLCAIAARREEAYVPLWYLPVTGLLQIHSGFTEWLTDTTYVAKVERYAGRVEAQRERLEGLRRAVGG